MWEVILNIRNTLKQKEELPRAISLSKEGDKISVFFGPVAATNSLVIHLSPALIEECDPLISNPFSIEKQSDIFTENEIKTLKVYLPYAFLEWCGRKSNKCFAISHFAQTLDGRISSCSGDSKWIGNEENLIHAHRMRALCSSILVGSKTIESDNPKLNVRMVEGPNPVKVILGGNGQFSRNTYNAINQSTLIFQDSNTTPTPFERIQISKNPDYNPHEVLDELAKRGIYSVYIEGGSYTTSSFLKEKALDQVQLHFSPRIIGSGNSSFNFEGIDKINEAITFSSGEYIPIGDDIMFVGKPNK